MLLQSLKGLPEDRKLCFGNGASLGVKFVDRMGISSFRMLYTAQELARAVGKIIMSYTSFLL